MTRIALVALAVTAVAGVAAYIGSAAGQSNGDAAPIYGVKIPAGYRDWRLISVKRLTGKQLTGAGGELKQLRAELGNDLAIKAYRDGTLPFPDGAIIAALHWNEEIVGFRQPSLGRRFSRPRPQIFLCRVRRERSIHGQGLKKVCRIRRLGIRRLHERQTWRRGAARKVLPLPPPAKDRDYVFTRYAPTP